MGKRESKENRKAGYTLLANIKTLHHDTGHPFLLMSDKRNHAHVREWEYTNFARNVSILWLLSSVVPLPPKKQMSIFTEKNYVIVRHTGMYKCPAVQKPNPPQEFQDDLLKDLSLKPSTASSKMLNTVRSNESTGSIDNLNVNLPDDRRLRSLKPRLCNN